MYRPFNMLGIEIRLDVMSSSSSPLALWDNIIHKYKMMIGSEIVLLAESENPIIQINLILLSPRDPAREGRRETDRQICGGSIPSLFFSLSSKKGI